MHDFALDLAEDAPVLDAALTEPSAYRYWRLQVLPGLVESNEHAEAIHILRTLVRSPSSSLRDRILLGRLLADSGSSDAVAYLSTLAVACGQDMDALTFILTRLIQLRAIDDAAQIAANFQDWGANERLTTLAAMALEKSGDSALALELLDKRGQADIAPHLEVRARLLNDFGRHDDAILLAKRAKARDVVSVTLMIEHARALESLYRLDEARKVYSEAIETDPKNVRALARRGEIFLEQGRAQSARDDLALASQLAPRLNKIRLVYARALKACGEFAAAAEALVTACAEEPHNDVLTKLAAAALNQAGNQDAADQLYGKLQSRRSDALPDDFALGLQSLWDEVDTFSIPQSRLDWAWRLRDQSKWTDRNEWERRAKWGALADKLFYDWLECRSERIEEVLPVLSDLTPVSESINELLAQERGVIVASAHIGAMFAGPLALELIGTENRWLASIPSLPSIGFSHNLISTSDQTEGQVARQSVRALANRCTLTVAVDGAMSLAAPTIDFERQRVTYSSFAARLAFKQNAPSVFAMPRWVNGVVEFHLSVLPVPNGSTDIEQFTEDWRRAYLDCLKTALADDPENLRLSGGLWRDIR